MANRPKESLSGIVGVLGGLYSANKLAKIQNNFSKYSSDLAGLETSIDRMSNEITGTISKQTELQAYGFQSIIELQAGTIFGISKVNNSIESLEMELSKVTNLLERQERREENVGDLKLIIMEIEEAMDHIDTLKEEYTPWAGFETKVLLDLVEQKEITISDFKRLPPTEIKYVKNILNRIQDTHHECIRMMESSSILGDYETLLSAMEKVILLQRGIPELEKKESLLQDRISSVKEDLRESEKNLFHSVRYMNSRLKEPEPPEELDKRKIMNLEAGIEMIQHSVNRLESEYKLAENEISDLKKSIAGKSLLKSLFTFGNANLHAEISIIELRRDEVNRKLQLELDEIKSIKSQIVELKEIHKFNVSNYDRFLREHVDMLNSLKKESNDKERVIKERIENLNQSINSKKSELEQSSKDILESKQEIISALESVAHLTPHNSEL